MKSAPNLHGDLYLDHNHEFVSSKDDKVCDISHFWHIFANSCCAWLFRTESMVWRPSEHALYHRNLRTCPNTVTLLYARAVLNLIKFWLDNAFNITGFYFCGMGQNKLLQNWRMQIWYQHKLRVFKSFSTSTNVIAFSSRLVWKSYQEKTRVPLCCSQTS